MNLDAYAYALALAEEKNYTRAAERVFISQPALSKAINKIETELGVTLFTRDHKQVQLTPAGEIFVETARQILWVRDRAYSRIRQQPLPAEKRIRIGINRLFTLEKFSDAIVKFYEKFPGTIPDIYELDSLQSEKMLLSGWLDAAMILSEKSHLDGLTHYKIGEDELAVILPDTPEFQPLTARYQGEIPLSALRRFPAIRNRRNSKFDDMLNAYFESENYQPNYIGDLSNMVTAIQSARSGFAMAFCHKSILQLTSGDYPYIYNLQPPLHYYHYFCFLPDKNVSEPVQFMLALLLGKES